MASLLERLQEALSPEYDVQRELAAGGMGIVFLARHLGLDRRVAIKVLAPELASSAAAQRFLREARILASLSHSHVIPIHHVGEADGLFYYVMDYMDGETLADALRRGPMGVDDVVKLGRDLLDALEAVHDRDVVHRDVKPANIFLSGKRALLGDFGIAKQDSGADQTLTQPGGVIGTPSYMAPEQLAGETVTARTDIYAVAMVLYEAMTGRQWKVVIDPEEASWAGIPIGVARVLRGALAFVPTDRWPDAVTFRHKLWGTRVRRYQWRTAALTAAGIVVGVLGIWAFGLLNRAPGPGGLSVQITQFQEEGEVPPGLTDAVMDFVVRGLGQSLEFQVCEPEEPCDNPTVTLHCTVRVSESTLFVTVRTEDLVQYSSRDGQVTEWREVADAVAYDVLRELWSANSPLAEWLPLNALPTKSTAGFNLWLEAELIFTEGRWGDAREPYLAAYDRDSTCFLCLWRLREIGRQYPGFGADDELIQPIYRHKDLFPEHYQALIELDGVAESERIPYLERAAEQWPGFFYLRFRLGEEIFNRGGLMGRSRKEAIGPLEEALVRWPEFALAWEHLASVAIAEGDRETAVSALAGLEALPAPTDPWQGAYGLLIHAGFAYRFEGDANGAGVVRLGLAQPGVASMPDVVVSARLMPSFDSPNGAIDVGRLFETDGRGGTRWKLAGLMGQMFGYWAMGQLDSARVHAREIVRMGQLGEFSFFADQIDAFLMMFDDEEAAAGLDRNDVMRRLQRRLPDDAAPRMVQKRAAWTLSLLQRQAGDDAAADRNAALVAGLVDDSSDPLVVLLDAHARAMAEDLDRALQLANTLGPWERPESVSEDIVGPFFRTVVHLLRAEWYAASDNPEAARQQLLWHQNWDQDGLPTAEPRVEEVDWAFGTLARWRRAKVLEPDDLRRCDIYRDIVRLWSDGDPVYAARADTARQFVELNCPASS